MRNTSCDTPPAAAVPAADPLRGFAVPPQDARRLVALCRQYPRALDPDYGMALPAAHRAAIDSFHARRSQLLRDVLGAGQPSSGETTRNALPDVSHLRTQPDVLKHLLRTSSGVVVGEAHASRASKRLLIDHMRLLRTLGVDTLYLEHLQADIHQADLDLLHQNAGLTLPLKQFLSDQDRGHMTDAASGATFRAVVDAATRAGVRIVALDLMASYHLKGAKHEVTGDAHGDHLRTRVLNHVAAARIEHDQHRPGAGDRPRRWIALVGNTHAGTFDGIAGIAGRLGVPSMRVEDIHDANAPRLQAGIDPGLTVLPSALRAHGHLRCDYLLQVRSPT
ncbi:membrane-targeted effector domain-containing toxin [Stenotrophomonas sp. PD6]|uniref:membrane-targeted effector domain-containing toxin n=1 Tax=Stenotrophomonas sp. PD6 TaxID=3368612 RepID=UPI003BA2C05A